MDVVERYADSFVDGLIAGGVRNVVVCPGSRSTPIVLAFARRRKEVRPWVLYDERSAGFFALGIAESSSEPVALVSTSGSAAANFLPAVIEARYSRIPLVVITADRPPEMRDFGGAQTIDQVRLYGSHVKWFQDLPVGAELPALFRYSAAVGLRAAGEAGSSPVGPVHVNFPLREPLLSASPAKVAKPSGRAGMSLGSVEARATKESVKAALTGLEDGTRGVIVVGPGNFSRMRKELSALSKVLGWPILADSLSNLRQNAPGVISCYEFLVRNKAFRQANAPKWVIRVGGVPTSKELNLFCEGAKTVLLDEGEWRDPEFLASRIVRGELRPSLSLIAETLKGFRPAKGWLEKWLGEDEGAKKRLDALMASVKVPFEGRVFHSLSKTMRPRTSLTMMVGSSMPVRDLDYFFHGGSAKLRLRSNRGANGIDGVVSTAMGVAAAEGNVLLVLGDISFYHDMNGLLAANLYGLNATVVVVNNKGGGIFSFLSQRSLPDEVFEEFFGESHDLDFSGVKTIYGGTFCRVSNWKDFDEAVSSSIDAKGLKIVELLALDRESNVRIHRKSFEAIASGVKA